VSDEDKNGNKGSITISNMVPFQDHLQLLDSKQSKS